MPHRFEEYMRAEIDCIAREIERRRCTDRAERNRLAIEWIEKNAEWFREQWFRRYGGLENKVQTG